MTRQKDKINLTIADQVPGQQPGAGGNIHSALSARSFARPARYELRAVVATAVRVSARVAKRRAAHGRAASATAPIGRASATTNAGTTAGGVRCLRCALLHVACDR